MYLKTQSSTEARPRTTSSARALQEGAPQEPQSRPSRESAISSTRAIFSMAEAMSSSSFSTGTYSRGASQSISGVTASMWFRLTGRCFRMR